MNSSKADYRASLIIITYNQLEYLKEQIESTRCQSTSYAFEVIVVNDCSNDNTEEYLGNLDDIDNLTAVNNPRNMGRAEARNIGAARASGDIFIFVDGDLRLSENFIESHVAFHESNDGVALGKVVFRHRGGFCRYLQRTGAPRIPEAPELPFRYFVSWNFSVKKDSFQELKGFDTGFLTSFYNMGEDLELGYRIHKSGTKIYYLPSALAVHIEKPDLKNLIEKRYAYGFKSLPLFKKKHPEAVRQIPVFKLFDKRTSRFWLRLALNPVFYHPIKMVALIVDCLPDIFYEYLIHGAVFKGLLKSGGKYEE
jgi:GT2 family glycosyltransferase